MAVASAPVTASVDQAAVVAFLATGAALGCAAPPRRIDTHAATIFLGPDRAWKLKRAVRFAYLDFSTPDRRRAALDAELVLNLRTAPGLYLAVHPITRDAAGGLALDGPGDAVDWLLEMHRFPDGALLDEIAGTGALEGQLLVQLADAIVAFHRDAAPALEADGAAILRDIVAGNQVSMALFPEILPPDLTDRLCAAHLDLVGRHAPLLDRRARTGRVRHGHGDLHLANIALIEGHPTLFDCLEFDPALATIDVLYDLAFLLMDCWRRGLHAEANILFNRYLDRSPEEESGMALLPLFLSVRAAIRAHVLAAQSQRAGDDRALADMARAYLRLAEKVVRDQPIRLIAIGGLSGTGKSAVARALAGSFGPPPGARILRSDVMRKRAAGVAPETRLTSDHYAGAVSARVYATIDRLAAAALAQHCAVIADAVFARRDERDAIEVVAERKGVPFSGLWLETVEAIRVRRVTTRQADASDADARVVRAQRTTDIGDLDGWRTVDANAALPEVVAAAMAEVGHRR
ncbi:MAG: AAA family ATPase [Sphingomonas sp.]